MTMISILRKTSSAFLPILFGLLLLLPQISIAQGVSLSVTPTLIEMTGTPGQLWRSNLKVVNSNPFELTVYAQVVNFSPQGELGHGTFFPLTEGELQGATLGEWITVRTEPIVIPRESSMTVPITLNIPETAAPGGHYAAIMVGTRPPTTDGALVVRTSQVVTSLFFVRVSGDVVESGTIRSFRPLSRVVPSPEVTFELRFENEGNVHLQPQGTITITNMWGAERGVIPINRETMFGNVLPGSIRKFEFTWAGVFSLAEIGRYKAEVTLGYGVDARQFATRVAYFWVLPVKGLALFLIVLLGVGFFIRYAIRSYIRRMLSLAGVDPDLGKGVAVHASRIGAQADVRIGRRAYTAPVKAGYRDLLAHVAERNSLTELVRGCLDFVSSYRVFFASVVGFVVLLVGIVAFWSTVRDTDVPYEVTFIREGNDVTVTSDQLEYEAEQPPTIATDEISIVEEEIDTLPTIIITNASGVSGVAAQKRQELEEAGYAITELRTDLSDLYRRTVIIYTEDLAEEALAISAALDNALLSASSKDTSEGSFINVIVGADLVAE
jgi:hypothetical protein